MLDSALDLCQVRRALIIDDEGAVRAVLRRWLTRRGWNVSEAPDGAAALASLCVPAGTRESPFDVVICDLRMPALSGPELHAWATLHRPAILRHLVFASGDVQEAVAADFLQSCGCPVLEKPFELIRLEEIIAELAARV